MKQTYKLLAIFATLTLILSACGGTAPAEPTADAAAIATSAVQTVEARYTAEAQAVPAPTNTPEAPIQPTATQAPLPTATQSSNPNPAPAQGACLYASFIADITVPDGMIMLPGSAFTKTWQIKNIGTCPWGAGYSLVFESGEAMTETLSWPLAQVVNPGQSVNISVNLTAPTAEGLYTGRWRIATPFGGTFGVGQLDQSLSVVVTVSSKPDKAFSVIDVSYTITRDPKQGCPAKGVVYTITATIAANGQGTVEYHWTRNPTDQSKPESGKLTYAGAGSKTISNTWTLKPDALQNIDRWMAIYVDVPNNQEFSRVLFTFTCQ